ncbi:MAG: DUF4124 domain-containing protein [Gammaproteobacteria bacterium]|nr:DUF4124 domain-containing protein [Gammaproteobacteria bacterium]
MKAFFVVLLLLPALALAAGSKVYRWVGPDGATVFSDEARPGAEEVEIPPVQTMPALEAPRATAPDDGKGPTEEAAYQSFSFVAPQQDQGVRANNGVVGVRMTLEPPLRAGHSIAVTLDGEPMGGNAPLSFQLPALDRGTHTIEAEVVDATGESVISAGPITFHVLRAALGGGP